jgi:hypothetical protein
MENNKFFMWIWRINGILILGGAAVIALFIAYKIAKDFVRSSNRPQENIVESVAEDPHNKEKWILGRPSHINGNNFILIPLVSENKAVKIKEKPASSKSYYNKSTSKPAKNILFLDSENNKSFWLFEDTQRLILDTSQFPNAHNSEEATKAIFYHVVSEDSNSDKVLNYKDDSSLFISNPKGGDYQLVLKAYDKVISKSMVSTNKIMIIYQFEGTAYSMLIQLSPYEIISNEKLPKIKNS